MAGYANAFTPNKIHAKYDADETTWMVAWMEIVCNYNIQLYLAPE